MIRGDRIDPTAFRLSHRGSAKPCTQLGGSDQFDDDISQSSCDAIPLAGEDHAGVTISDVSGELRQITHHRDGTTRHGLERSDR